MSPIRVGIIGLGRSTGAMGPGQWAALAHLPFLLASPHYQVVAVSNSSVSSAQASIEFHKLGPECKAYGSPEDIADDPEVDLVVVSVQVGKHYQLAKPALLKGKNVFVEWPLGASTKEAEELTALAEKNRSKTIVGVQARASPLVGKLRELIQGGRIGTIQSSTVTARFSGLSTTVWPQSAKYYLDIDSGGNSLTIMFGHFLDSFVHVLGGFESLTARMSTAHDKVDLINDKAEVVEKGYHKTSPDNIRVDGTLVSGASASLIYSTPEGDANEAVLRWLIKGTDGQLEVVVPAGQWQMDPEGIILNAQLGKAAEIKAIDWEAEARAKEVKEIQPHSLGSNTARQYQAFVDGDHTRAPEFKDVVETQRLLDRILAASKI